MNIFSFQCDERRRGLVRGYFYPVIMRGMSIKLVFFFFQSVLLYVV